MGLFSLHHDFPSGYQQSHPVTIYQEARHRELAATTWKSFYLVRTDVKKVLADVHFRISRDQAVSRPAAPFGGISFDPRLPLEEIQKFIKEMHESLRALRCSAVTLVQPPAAYQPSADLLLALLHDEGYARIATEICSFLEITSSRLRDRFHEWEFRKLIQAERAGVTCVKLPGDRLSDVYRFLSACREERGYQLSMTEAQVLQLADAFPEAIQLYAAIKDGQWCAAVLGLQDNPSVLYTFYYGHTAATDSLSPMVLLLEFVYGDCQSRDLYAINLGTSTLNSATNVPLLQFKLQLGATPVQKVTLTKSF